jgi:hypothetical protein
MASPSFDRETAKQLLDNIGGFIHLVYIHPNGIGISGKDFGSDIEEALDGAAAANGNGYNVYWTTNYVRPGLDKKPAKTDIRAARFVHVDIDPPKSGGAFNKVAIAAAMTEIEAPPSFIIDSGGGLQAFWRLDEPCENLSSIEAINTQVRDYFEADACQNIDRLMRLPGSVNYPDKKKQMRGRTPALARFVVPDEGICYEPQVLAAAFPAAKPTSVEPRTINLPSGIEPVAIDALGLGELDPVRLAVMSPPGQDRSGDGIAAARLMANAGFSDAQIMGVLLNPSHPVSAHFLDQRDSLRAAARAIQLVRRDSPPEGEPLHAPLMPRAEFDQFVANELAKVRKRMVPATLRDEEPEQEPRPRIGVPAWRRDLGSGALAEFVEHTLASAPSPQPWLTLGAGIAMFGAVAGRRYAGPTNLRTNIYSIGVADSGGGKDHPLRASTRLMIAAGLANHVGSSKIASGAGLVTAITRNPSIYFPIDEVGFLLSAAADRKRSPKHLTEIIDNLTEFYSLADSTFLGTAYANDKEKPREVIEQPCLCLFGVTTPAVFWGSLSSANVMDGSLARMLIFESENHYPDPQHDPVPVTPPRSLTDAVEAIALGAEGQNPFPMGNASAIVPKPYTVPYTDPRAAAVGREMRQMQIEMLRKHQGTQVTGIIARLAENAAKIALIKAITENPARPSISANDLDWGMLVARTSVETLMSAVKERVADTDQEAKLKRLQMIIASAGSAGIDHENLFRQARFMGSRRHLNEALDFLSEGGSIRAQEFETERSDGKKAAKKRRVYFDIE